MEVYVLVGKKKSGLSRVLGIVFLVVGIISAFFSMLGYLDFLLSAVFGIAAGYFLGFRNCEYEYSYFDGEVRFARIINKSRRKELKGYHMRDVLTIAPINDRSVYIYLHNSQNKTKKYTSENADAKVYVMVAKAGDGLHVIQFEPDERFLDEVCVKYGQKVVK